MNYRVISTADSISIVKTGAAAKDGEVFTDLKIARAVVVDATEARIRHQRTKREAELTEARKVALAEDAASFELWRARRDAVTTTREKDLLIETTAQEPA